MCPCQSALFPVGQHDLIRRKQPSLWFEFDRHGLSSAHSDADTFEPAHVATATLDMMALAHVEDGFHQGWQLAEKDRLTHRRQLARVRDLLKKLPCFRAGDVSLGIECKILSNEAPDRAFPRHSSAIVRLVDERGQQRDGTPNSLKFRVRHTP